MTWTEWLSGHWRDLVIPIIAFLATYLIGLWLRTLLYNYLGRSAGWKHWRGSQTIGDAIRRPLSDWLLILGAYIAVHISVLSPANKLLAGRILGTIFVISLAWVVALVADRIIKLYAPANRVPRPAMRATNNVFRVIIIITAALVVLSLWGLPVSPILLALAVIIFIAGIALRDVIPGYFSSLQISAEKKIKPGDFIRLDSGEAGQVQSVSWQSTHLQSVEGHNIIIPNSKLSRATVVNYGKPTRQATHAFHFSTRLHLRELTGLRACNLTELLAVLKDAPDSVVYYHVHRFLEEHLYLAPEPTNDFAIWVNDALGHDILAERLASLDIFSFPNIGAVKQLLVREIEDHLKSNPDDRRCEPGDEFHFIRSISFVLPTQYVAHNLRDFVEILRKITVQSIYFHIFESHLRLQRGTNDFSIWIAESLGEKELADKLAAIDPYTYTLENLRTRIIGEVETYIR